MLRGLRCRHIVEAALVMFVIILGVWLRAGHLDASAFWVDEAESSINALTILEHGYPVDHYLNIPIYENTLIKPWPGHPEYEFKDISYSDSGMAIYHGWLPLYSIAASFAFHGIQSDTSKAGTRHLPDLSDMKRRTRAARIPSVIFGALFLGLCYVAGSLMYGRDAGAAALCLAAIASFHIRASVQARYYSAELTLSVAAVTALWLLMKSGKWRHYIAAAIVFLLLFFTHLMTFASALMVLALITPVLLRRGREAVLKLTVFGMLLLAGAGAWLAKTGFLAALGLIPPIRNYLAFPADLFLYPLARSAHLVLFASFLFLIAAASSSRWRMPTWVAAPVKQSATPVIVLAAWIVAAYSAFFLFIPAVSFDVSRMKFPYWGVALVLGSIFCAVLARMLSPKRSILIAPAVAILLAMLTGVKVLEKPSFTSWDRMASLRAYLQQAQLPPHTKLYAVPNLILKFYFEMPFQSIYPVRRAFLNEYEGDVIFVDSDDVRLQERNQDLASAALRQAAEQSGESLDDQTAELLSRRLRTLNYRRSMSQRIGRGTESAAEFIPPFARPLLKKELASIYEQFPEMCAGTPILRGYPINNWHDWIEVFVYRFVDPQARMGPLLNYAGRLRGSTADILTDTGWVIYRSTAKRATTRGISFNLLP